MHIYISFITKTLGIVTVCVLPQPLSNLQTDLIIDSSSTLRTLSETVEYLETAHPPIFAGEIGDMDNNYEAHGRHVAIIDDLKSRLLQKDTAFDIAQREKQCIYEKYDESLRVIETFEATIRDKDEALELYQQDERDRNRRSRENDAQYKRELANLTTEHDQLLVSHDELSTRLERYSCNNRELSRNNRELVQRNIELKKTIESGADYKQSLQADAVRRPPETMRDFAPPVELPPQKLEEEVERLRIQNTTLQQTIKNLRDENLHLMVRDSEWTSERIQLENKNSNQEVIIARLHDENENYEIMMRQKTLNGEILNADFMHNSESAAGGKALGSLAEELEAAGDEHEEGETESIAEFEDKNSQLHATIKRQNQTIKDLTAENKDLIATKKAQNQYINNIITRVLQFSDLQDILNVNPEETAKAAAAHKAKLNMHKDLPAPPSARSSSDSDRLPASTEGGISGYIKRSISNVRRSRPSSTVLVPSPNQHPWDSLTTRNDRISPLPTPLSSNQNETETTGISLIQGHGHRRTRSELSNDLSAPNVPAPAAIVVDKMYRPSPGGPSSPASLGGAANRTSYFPAPVISRTISGVSADNKVLSATRSTSTASAPPQTIQPPSYDTNLTPSGLYSVSITGTTALGSLDGDETRSVMGPPRNAAGMTQYTSAVTTQKGMRPLRMVQDRNDLDAAKKKANRQSWFGGMFGGKT